MKKRLGLVIDQERCIGCEACTVACIKENGAAEAWIHVRTEGAVSKDTPQGRFPDLKMVFSPTLCNHCDEPPCLDVCPPGALVKREDGPVLLIEDKCDGCEACIEACPYGAIRYSREKGKAGKCNLCAHRIDRGLAPFCVVCCEGQAIHFGDLNDPGSPVSRMVRTRGAFQLNPEAGTGPSVYYCRPREPRGI